MQFSFRNVHKKANKKGEKLQDVFGGEGGVGTVFDFKDDAFCFEYFECVPLSCGDVDAVLSLQGVEQGGFGFFFPVVVVCYFYFSPEKYVGFCGVEVAVNGYFRSGFNGVQEALRTGLGRGVEVVVHPETGAVFCLCGDLVQ